MRRFLILEDQAGTVRALASLLATRFPGAQIDTAGNAAVGLEHVRRAHAEDRRYDAAFLDFLLPPARGRDREVDESVCNLLDELMPETLVAHITSNEKLPDVQKHLQEVHLCGPEGGAFVILKTPHDWAGRLLKILKAEIYGTPIKAELDAVFGRSVATDEGVRRRSRGSANGLGTEAMDITHRVALLCAEIAAHWDDLDPKLQRCVEGIFNVDTAVRPIRISLL